MGITLFDFPTAPDSFNGNDLMKRFFLGVIFGVLIATAAMWYFSGQHRNPTFQDTRDRVESGAKEVAQKTKDQFNSWGLTPDSIREEFSKTGRVIRRKAEEAETAIANAASDTKITTMVKGKYVADKDLSALSISVNTTDGLVTLSGTASSPENVQKAITLAMDTPGVREVVSNLQVK